MGMENKMLIDGYWTDDYEIIDEEEMARIWDEKYEQEAGY